MTIFAHPTTPHDTPAARVSLLGTGAMGTAFGRAWLAAGHPLTVWNRTAERTRDLAAAGADVARTAAAAVAAADLVVTVLWDDASVGTALDGADLTGRALVDLTTGTPEDARGRAAWAHGRGARFLSGGVMAVPPMIGVPGSGAFVLYSGDDDVFAAHRDTLAVPAEPHYTGAAPGRAALLDVALLSAMYGMFGGTTHAFALVRDEGLDLPAFADLLAGFLTAMAGSVHETAARLAAGAPEPDTDSGLRMQVAGAATLLRTAAERRVSPELVAPYLALMERALREGREKDGDAGLLDLLRAP